MGKERFIKVYSEGTLNVTQIFVDKVTGVNYMFHCSGNAGGLTPLLNKSGQPMITPISDYE
ncbi:DUF6440 family protein [Anaerofustis stercorihominis]|uniref:DUF6440 domain-containing protein n=1 Tax=Anaerofustis stercorihominis DSM 17244 TaxID=445971 RepID=B1C6G3_9FIRM|nr:DUF6440 family protein [Anaerofustis stercorihominis]EDS73448.1 hypothetical protein ANASTE_00303 [Anaerofustis stercorihominis DSM 17244]MCQ4794967.1 DUF6440 family protein [Anaerofustis stercorihominis]